MNTLNDIDFLSSNKAFIVAEIGINHNGDLNLAKELIVAAAESGANSVKFQNYKTEDFVTDPKLMLEYNSDGKIIKKSQFEIFKGCELDRSMLFELKELSDSLGLIFHSSPTSIDGIKDLESIGCKILKNGSDYLTNLRLIQAMGKTGLLTVISTGMSELFEIEQAVKTFQETGNNKLLLLHCTSSYPTKLDEVNLSRIKTLKEKFNFQVGFSDHTEGELASIGAILMGAIWIEKHFTLDKKLPGPDHWFSINPEELKSLVSNIRKVETMIGSNKIIPTKSEEINRKEFRLSCVARRDLPIGTIVKSNDIDFQRPGDGIHPSQESFLINKKLSVNIKKGQKFEIKHFDE